MCRKLVIFLPFLLAIHGCDEEAFDNATAVITLYPGSDILRLTITGCLDNETDEITNAIDIKIRHQTIPILFVNSVVNLPYLEHLMLEKNEIEELKPGAFKQLPQISTINLSFNLLKTIPMGVFNGLQVEKIVLLNNSINSIDLKAFADMPRLWGIDLAYNKLKSFDPNWFTGTPKLHRFSMDNNRLEKLPENAFVHFQITSLELGFFGNQIQMIQGQTFVGVKSIFSLDLKGNQIESLDGNLFGKIDSIRLLYLNNNRITCLTEEFLKTLNGIKHLGLTGNPLECDCWNKTQSWARVKEKAEQLKKKIVREIDCN